MFRSTLLRIAALAVCGAVSAAAAAFNSSNVSAGACTTWYETTAHATWFRNVKDYGAKGDGVTDDTAAIMTALTQGRTSEQTTKNAMVVYLPAGRYLVSGSLPLWFYTHLVGNFLPGCRSTLVLAPNTWPSGSSYVLSADLSDSGDHDDEFYRAVRHVDIEISPGNAGAGGIHWSVSQATHIRDVNIAVGDGHTGIFGENGSGGFISDLTVTGGDIGLSFGNQQWFWRSITISGCRTAGISFFWNWAMSLVDLNISNVPVGIQFQGGAQGSLLIQDSVFSAVTTALLTDYPARSTNLLLERVTATNVQTITNGLPGSPSGTVTIPAWRQGPWFAAGNVQNGNQSMVPLSRPDAPLPVRPRPVFGDASGAAGIANALSYGADPTGATDSTKAIQAAITANAQVFLPGGVYLVSGPINLTANSVLVGECDSILLAAAGAAAWADYNNPQPLLYAPPGSTVQLADILFSTAGDNPGVVYLDWNAGPASGLWDVHWRLEHTGHTGMRVGFDDPAGTGGYFSEFWVWVADHSIDTGAQLNVTNANGVVVVSQAPSYWYGTASEHSYLSQYNFTGASNVTAVITQTESPYWQVPPTAWAMWLQDVTDSTLYGSGWYNWFNGNQTALFSVTNVSNTNAYCINVHGTENVMVGDMGTIPAYSPVEEEWFCDGFAAYTSL